MGHQLTTLLHRLGGGVRPGATVPATPLPHVAPDVPAASATAARLLLPKAEQDRYDRLVDEGLVERAGEDTLDAAGRGARGAGLGGGEAGGAGPTGSGAGGGGAVDRGATESLDAAGRATLARTLASTGSVAAVEEMADVLRDAPTAVRRAVADPVRRLGRDARQSDGTTCGSAVLGMLAATGDPTLALWLATGQVLGSARPPELKDAPDRTLDRLRTSPPQARAAALQRVLKARTNGRALLGLPWPTAFGTPPWSAAEVARFLGVRYTHLMLDDTDRPHVRRVLDQVARSVASGVPVPLYTGGDSGQGWAAALPRHVVLAVGRTTDGLMIWEPSAGATVTVTRAAVLAGDRPLRALGGWRHLSWALLPAL
jgi:hypothetical protein